MDSMYLFFSLLLADSLSLLSFLLLRNTTRRKLRLPPGTLGLPFIRETLQLISAYKTENPEPFMDDRVAKYGTVFTTHIFGEPTDFSASPIWSLRLSDLASLTLCLSDLEYPSSLSIDYSANILSSFMLTGLLLGTLYLSGIVHMLKLN